MEGEQAGRLGSSARLVNFFFPGKVHLMETR